MEKTVTQDRSRSTTCKGNNCLYKLEKGFQKKTNSCVYK